MNNIIKRLKKFRKDRNWEQFHTPENLSKSIIIEASELLENFQWGSKKVDLKNVKEELADIMAYVLLLCDHYDLDIKQIMNDKIDINEKKYPIEKAFGKSTKYDKY